MPSATPLPPIYLCTQADIIERMGGAAQCAQVLDPQQTGTYDTALLDRARLDASSDLMSAGGNRVKLWAEQLQTPQWVVGLAAWRGVYYVWLHGTGGKAVPENVKVKGWEGVEADLQRMRQGESGTGYGEPPTRTNPDRGGIDNSDGGRRMVYSTFSRSGWR